jgi:hypothetical protein
MGPKGGPEMSVRNHYFRVQESWILEPKDGIDRMSRNVGKKLILEPRRCITGEHV